MTLAAICKRLNVTDQTIRDVALLERAPAELHQLVRDGQCTGTLAIEQIRLHGGDRALERIVAGISKAAEAGKSKVTKKYLEAAPLLDAPPAPASSAERVASAEATTSTEPVAASMAAEVTVETQAQEPTPASPRQSIPAKINEKHSKQLLQALQAVLHDKNFGRLAKPTIEAVHTALMPLTDLLDTPTSRKVWPISEPDANGGCKPVDTVCGPERTGFAIKSVRRRSRSRRTRRVAVGMPLTMQLQTIWTTCPQKLGQESIDAPRTDILPHAIWRARSFSGIPFQSKKHLSGGRNGGRSKVDNRRARPKKSPTGRP
ncbi:hypothetical protein JYG32_00555 [Burkholderia pyrrocinia]|nr:hypothetical protein JYG32_00555 [Burkholderia pyrrocinia]